MKDWTGYADVFTQDLILDTEPPGGYKVGCDQAIRTIRSSFLTASRSLALNLLGIPMGYAGDRWAHRTFKVRALCITHRQ
jgi:hypothetical protein